ncbi:hypothetical protein HAX54_039351, partial [Datura stramonium]|nr:hypothetical protein [Datura stramonium]
QQSPLLPLFPLSFHHGNTGAAPPLLPAAAGEPPLSPLFPRTPLFAPSHIRFSPHFHDHHSLIASTTSPPDLPLFFYVSTQSPPFSLRLSSFPLFLILAQPPLSFPSAAPTNTSKPAQIAATGDLR